LVRHELIAMQLGMSPGGAEFYPACLQIRLAAPSSGSPAPLPSGDLVVNFPGGYSDTDPGILDPDVYNPGSNYTFPGPALISSAVADPSSSDGPADPTTSTGTSSEDNSPTSSSATSTPTNNGCGGNPNKKRKRHVVRRIVRQGPLIRKSTKAAKPLVKREATPTAAPNANAHRARADHPNNIVRSRVMRGVF